MICHHLRSSPYWLRRALSTAAMSSAQLLAHTGVQASKHTAKIERDRRMALFQQRIHLAQLGFTQITTHCVQAQLVHQGLCAQLQHGQFGLGGIVLGT